MAVDTSPGNTVATIIHYGERLQVDIVRRVREAFEDIESRRKHVVAVFEHMRNRQLGLLHRQLKVPSRQKVYRLSRRLYRLEQQLRG
jgi:hypothetical protein